MPSRIRFGPAGNPIGAKDALDALRILAEEDLHAMEVQFVRNIWMKENVAMEYRRFSREHDVLFSTHAPYYINLASAEEEKRKASIQRIARSAERTYLMGGYITVVHAAYYGGRDPNEVTRMVADGVSRAKELMDNMGVKGVLIGLEVMGKLSQWGTPEEIGKVMEEVDGVAPVMDWAHWHARTMGGLRTRKDFEAVMEKLLSIWDGRHHYHFSCIEWGKGGEKKHRTLGNCWDPDGSMGGPEFRILAELLADLDLEVTIISESPLLDRDALLMKKIYEEITKGRA
ncbi:MAG: deoxyribonuclease IV [Thermoplasmata archaeon]|nr:MAG: deoxyribonuclease IV [Thermoplasmata archaeon]